MWVRDPKDAAVTRSSGPPFLVPFSSYCAPLVPVDSSSGPSEEPHAFLGVSANTGLWQSRAVDPLRAK